LKQAVAREVLQDLELDPGVFSEDGMAALKSFVPMPNKHFSLLTPWYNIAILDLSTCDHFQKDPLWIAAQLGIGRYQVVEALKALVEHGLLIETETGYTKVESKIRLSLNSSHAEIRKFHYQMIEKAQEELSKKTSKQDFDRREISGITIATNPANLEQARQHILKAVHEAADMLSVGECTDLYQINTQLFSLLKKSEAAG
jgi:uncharacterized protein (TIGR02147 family)